MPELNPTPRLHETHHLLLKLRLYDKVLDGFGVVRHHPPTKMSEYDGKHQEAARLRLMGKGIPDLLSFFPKFVDDIRRDQVGHDRALGEVTKLVGRHANRRHFELHILWDAPPFAKMVGEPDLVIFLGR